MNDDELGRDMYSRLNLTINELHSIGLIKLDDVDIVSKIISMLPHDKYASIITILHNMEDLSTMTPRLVIGKLVAFEMSWKMGQEEVASLSKSIALTCDEHKKIKGKKQTDTSLSSWSDDEHEEEDDEEDDEGDDQDSTTSSDDEEVIQLIGVKTMLHNMRNKGVAVTIEVIIVDGY